MYTETPNLKVLQILSTQATGWLQHRIYQLAHLQTFFLPIARVELLRKCALLRRQYTKLTCTAPPSPRSDTPNGKLHRSARCLPRSRRSPFSLVESPCTPATIKHTSISQAHRDRHRCSTTYVACENEVPVDSGREGHVCINLHSVPIVIQPKSSSASIPVDELRTSHTAAHHQNVSVSAYRLGLRHAQRRCREPTT